MWCPPFHFASNKGVVGPEREWRDFGKPVLHIDSQFSGVISESVRVLQERPRAGNWSNNGIGETADSAWRSLGPPQPTASWQIEEEPLIKEEDRAFSPDAGPEAIANSALVQMVTSHPHGSRQDASSRQLSLFFSGT
jgi:hypothetical protein